MTDHFAERPAAYFTPAQIRDQVAAIFDGVIEYLKHLVTISSVSNASFASSEVERSADSVALLLREAGLPEVQVLRADRPDGSLGAPAVVARKPAADGAPTVLLYAHHDVQPPGEGWNSSPFIPIQHDDRLFGRGAADDKAGIVAHIGAIQALKALDPEFPLGITVFVEGEEEVGSPSFSNFLQMYSDLLRADVIIVADSANWAVGTPALTTSLRGLVDCEVTITVLEHAVHSGFFGGPVLDAITVLARLIATLHDDEGNVAVDGLVSGIAPHVDYPEDVFRADAGVLPGVQLAGEGSIAGRMWVKPAISVIGVDAPRVDEAANTIVPTATARISVRVAPGQLPQDAAAALRRHLESHVPWGAQIEVREGDFGRSFISPQDSVAMQLARQAFTDAWGVSPVDIGVGGSIPFIADLQDVFPDAAILVTGVEDPDSRAHGANESVHLGELERVIVAEAVLLARLAGQVKDSE